MTALMDMEELYWQTPQGFKEAPRATSMMTNQDHKQGHYYQDQLEHSYDREDYREAKHCKWIPGLFSWMNSFNHRSPFACHKGRCCSAKSLVGKKNRWDDFFTCVWDGCGVNTIHLSVFYSLSFCFSKTETHWQHG